MARTIAAEAAQLLGKLRNEGKSPDEIRSFLLDSTIAQLDTGRGLQATLRMVSVALALLTRP